MIAEASALTSAQAGDADAFARLVAPYRQELRAHCYRMSGRIQDADDLVQESLLRAWKGLGSFEGRSSLRTWLYKVTTSACLDALEKRSAKVLPSELGPASVSGEALAAPRLEPIWLEPCPDELLDEDQATPEACYSARESVTFAFLIALQLLPPTQRAVLILRDVLGWAATECAELLELSVAAVNSSLQRARESVKERAGAKHTLTPRLDDASTAELLARYVRAWEGADVPALVSLLHADATLEMPPLPSWLSGAAAIGQSLSAMVLTPDAKGSIRLVSLRANGLPAFAAYRKDVATNKLLPMAIHVLEPHLGRIAAITAFIDPALFAAFGLPSDLAAND